MRILVAGPPKTGNVWFEKLLSVAFGLEWIRSAPQYGYWERGAPSPIQDFIAAGRYPDRSICHQHYWPSEGLFDDTKQYQIGLATTLRDPYDQFVSWYFYVQNFSQIFVASGDPGQRAIGKPIDHPDVLELLQQYFSDFLEQGLQWLQSGRSLIVRYEALHDDPEAVLTEAQRYFGLTPVRPFSEAVAAASANMMRREGPDLERHIRAGKVDTWRDHLSDAHLEIFRQTHAERLTRLGYSVR